MRADKTCKILREGVNMDDPPTDGLDGSLSIGLGNLPLTALAELLTTDDGFNLFNFNAKENKWQESIAIEQLNTVKWLAIGGPDGRTQEDRNPLAASPLDR